MKGLCRSIAKKLNYYLVSDDTEQERNIKIGVGLSSDSGLMRKNLKTWRNRV